jgi:hypothetical protein
MNAAALHGDDEAVRAAGLEDGRLKKRSAAEAAELHHRRRCLSPCFCVFWCFLEMGFWSLNRGGSNGGVGWWWRLAAARFVSG